MKTLTKLLTTTALTIGLFSNAAYADNKICHVNSKIIAVTYASVEKIANTSLFDKSGAIEHLRNGMEKPSNNLSVKFIMANHALDFVNEHFEQMQNMTNTEIKRIGYTNCEAAKKNIREQYTF